jgi:hypothetical protein
MSLQIVVANMSAKIDRHEYPTALDFSVSRVGPFPSNASLPDSRRRRRCTPPTDRLSKVAGLVEAVCAVRRGADEFANRSRESFGDTELVRKREKKKLERANHLKKVVEGLLFPKEDAMERER